VIKQIVKWFFTGPPVARTSHPTTPPLEAKWYGDDDAEIPLDQRVRFNQRLNDRMLQPVDQFTIMLDIARDDGWDTSRPVWEKEWLEFDPKTVSVTPDFIKHQNQNDLRQWFLRTIDRNARHM
jgi:hypothetical protein